MDETAFPNWVVKFVAQGADHSLPARFPFIVDEDTGDICEIALLYIVDRQLARDGKTYCVNTVDAYTRDLLDWMRFGSAYRIPWHRATWKDLENYVETMEADIVSPHHGESYASSTISRRLIPILGLYQWARECGLVTAEELPKNSLCEARTTAEWIDERRKLKRRGVRASQEHVADIEMTRVMLEDEVKDVLKAIGPAPWKDGEADRLDPSLPSSVGHLGMELALQAGLRVSEVASLRLDLFEKFSKIDIIPARYYSVGPFRRKGGKRKKVLMHGVLVQKVLDYISGERKQVAERTSPTHGELLLHKHGRYGGRPVHKSWLQRLFRNACLAASVQRTVLKTVPLNEDWSATEQQEKVCAKYSFHDLRHTFAVWTYYARKAAGDSEPWKYIQEQLGHEDVATTLKIYLSVTQDFEAFVSDHFFHGLNAAAGIG